MNGRDIITFIQCCRHDVCSHQVSVFCCWLFNSLLVAANQKLCCEKTTSEWTDSLREERCLGRHYDRQTDRPDKIMVFGWNRNFFVTQKAKYNTKWMLSFAFTLELCLRSHGRYLSVHIGVVSPFTLKPSHPSCNTLFSRKLSHFVQIKLSRSVYNEVAILRPQRSCYTSFTLKLSRSVYIEGVTLRLQWSYHSSFILKQSRSVYNEVITLRWQWNCHTVHNKQPWYNL